MTRALPLLLLLAACADFPEVGKAEAKLTSPQGTPPLLTAEELALVATPPTASPGLSAEAAALHARADRLRSR